MTISFRCPYCKSLCAFDDKYKGRRAKCLACQKKFIIPEKSDVKPEKVKEKNKIAQKPKKGFYKAVFKDSWSAIFSQESISTFYHIEVITIAALVLYYASVTASTKISPPTNPIGAILFLISVLIFLLLLFILFCAIGRIFEIYMTFLNDTACGVDQLPPPFEDMEFPLWQHMLKPFFIFALSFIGIFFPLLIGFGLFEAFGLEKKPLIAFYTNDPMIILQVIWVLCVFSVPSAYIHIAMTNDWEALRPDYLLKPAFKAFKAYMLVFLLFAGLVLMIHFLDMMPHVLEGDVYSIILKSVAVLAAQVYVLWAIRTAGLFNRHYECYFKI